MSTRKLLLADDSITIQKVVNLTFADEGIEVISVGSGDAAMEKMAEVAPDLVMADVNMPGLTGYQVCERIKQDENLKNTPVILLVGSFEPFDEAEARRVGADDFLTKPFQSIRQLVSKVTALLDANDRSAANLYEATANNSFADTLEMNEPEITNSDQANELGDAGMDDEMIQSAPVSSFALDESAKFETKDFATYEDSEDHKKTQPLSVYDLKDFSFVAGASEKENEPQFSETAQANESQDFQSFTENNAASESEPYDFAENGETESPAQNNAEYNADESVSEAGDSDELVLTENAGGERKKENFASFLDSSDDDLLEIPFDEDDEWETEEQANDAADSTEPVAAAEESEDDSPVESENGKPEEAADEQNQSLIEKLPQPESFDENPAQETGEAAQAEEFNKETPSDEFGDNFQTQETDENSSPEDASQNKDARSEYAEPEEHYHGEDEIVVGSLLEPENNESVNGEKAGNRLENQSSTESAAQFSPELIDAVARRVVEMLSERVVREIAWEVVPQHADLVIKKAVEEKLAKEKLTE